MNYENYHLEDFLQDEEFKRWVLNPDAESEVFWNNWLISHPHQREIILKARELLLAVEFEATWPDQDDQDEVLLNILKGEASGLPPQKSLEAPAGSFKGLHSTFMRLAGVMLILVVALAVYFNLREKTPGHTPVKYITKENPRGQKSQISLPDGTVLWLNSESRIRYPERFTTTHRVVDLEGEAFFEVASEPDRPFTVSMGNLEVMALGTSFNISAFPGDKNIAVSLVAGKVLVKESIRDDDHQKRYFEEIELVPGEKLLYYFEDFSVQKGYYDFKTDIIWKDGTIYFDNASYEEVKMKLERWFNVKLVVRNGVGKPWHFSGEFERESLDRILTRIGFVKNFEFEKRDHEVIITYKN